MHLSSFCITSYKHWGKALNWNTFTGKKNQHFFSNYHFRLFCFPPLMYLASFFILSSLLLFLSGNTSGYTGNSDKDIQQSRRSVNWACVLNLKKQKQLWTIQWNYNQSSNKLIEPYVRCMLRRFPEKKVVCLFVFFSSQVFFFTKVIVDRTIAHLPDLSADKER